MATAWLIPPEALAEWLTLAQVLDDVGAVPCQSDPSAWWPEKKDLDSPATHGAIAACGSCDAREACASYALAAGEREGVWGGLLPKQSRRSTLVEPDERGDSSTASAKTEAAYQVEWA